MTVSEPQKKHPSTTDIRELVQQLELQKTALESTIQGVAITDAQGKIVWVNPSFTRITGYTSEEALGQTFRLLKSGRQDHTYYRELWETISTGNIWQAEIVNRRKDGSLFFEEQTITPVRSTNGEITNYISIMQDISARKQRELEMEAVFAAANSLRAASNRSDMAPSLLEQAQKLVNASGAAIAFPEPDTGEIYFEAAAGDLQVWAGARLGAAEGISGQALALNQPVSASNLEWEHRAAPLERIAGELAAACIPLAANQEAIAVLWVARQEPFGEPDMHKLEAMADIAAIAIRRAVLQEQTELQLHRLAALRAVDEAISSSLDLSVTMGILLDQVLWQLNVNAADVLLLNPRTTMLECAAARGFIAGIKPRQRGKIGEGAAGKVALTHRTIHIADPSANQEAFANYEVIRGEGFESYLAAPLIARGEVKGVLEIYDRSRLAPDRDWLNFMEAICRQAAIAIENALLFENLQRSNDKIAQAYDLTLEGWVRTLGLRDGETEIHTQRVTEITLRLARALKIDGPELELIRRGALLHDIGKMGIPDSILRKSGPLSDEERAIIRMHPIYAYDLLKPIPYLKGSLDIPYCHHEHWDGSGYPRRLQGEDIPLAARIFSVADVWDALTSDRPYRNAWSEEEAASYIRKQAKRQFDPRIVDLFEKTILR